MTLEQKQALAEQMADLAQEAGIRVPEQAGPDMTQVLCRFEPLLQAIAAAASDAGQRWAGERDAAALTEGLDEQDSALVRRVLELLEQ